MKTLTTYLKHYPIIRNALESQDVNGAPAARSEGSKPMTNKKLIEVALPLEAIHKASAREKSIRHGHPSTLHLWWARRR
jgi:uncharacterized protein DUF1156